MRLFFTDPSGGRVAIDTDRKQYCADYIAPETIISDDHRFIKVSDIDSLDIVLSEADFCGWGYSGSFLQSRKNLYKKRDIEQLIKAGRSLIGDPPADHEDIRITEMLHFIHMARETNETDSLIKALSGAYYMGMAVGFECYQIRHDPEE